MAKKKHLAPVKRGEKANQYSRDKITAEQEYLHLGGSALQQINNEHSQTKRFRRARDQSLYEAALAKAQVVAIQRLVGLDIDYNYPDLLPKLIWEGSALIVKAGFAGSIHGNDDVTGLVWVTALMYESVGTHRKHAGLTMSYKVLSSRVKNGRREYRWRTQWADIDRLIDDTHRCGAAKSFDDAMYRGFGYKGIKRHQCRTSLLVGDQRLTALPSPHWDPETRGPILPSLPFSETDIDNYVKALKKSGTHARLVADNCELENLDSYWTTKKQEDQKEINQRRREWENENEEMRTVILKALSDSPEGFTQKDLVGQLGLGSGKGRRIIKELIKEGKVTKTHMNVRLNKDYAGPLVELGVETAPPSPLGVKVLEQLDGTMSVRELMFNMSLDADKANAVVAELESLGFVEIYHIPGTPLNSLGRRVEKVQ